MTWYKACRDDQLWEREMTATRVGSLDIFLVRADTEIYAYVDKCPHLGAKLSEGTLGADMTITCALHQWCFDVRTGQGVNPAKECLRRVPVMIDHGDVFVEITVAEGIGA